MLINCDLGEALIPNPDPDVMPLIDMANIACGGHAGSEQTVQATLEIAQRHDTKIGLHPSYLDKVHFGRRELGLSAKDIQKQLESQICAFVETPQSYGLSWFHLKPHGALYLRMMQDVDCFKTLLHVCKQRLPGVHLVIQAGRNDTLYQNMADQEGVPLLREAFADRAYLDNGELAPRSQKNSLYTQPKAILAQAQALIHENRADTLCFHSDNPASVIALTQWRQPPLAH